MAVGAAGGGGGVLERPGDAGRVAARAVAGAVLRGTRVAAVTVRGRTGMAERPGDAGLLVAFAAFGLDLGVCGCGLMTRLTVVPVRGVRERELGAGLVTGLAFTTHHVLGLVTRRASRCRHVVASRAVDCLVVHEIGLAAIDDCGRAGLAGFDLRGLAAVDAGRLQRRGGHGVPGGRMALDTRSTLGVIVMVEAGTVGRDVLVTGDTALIGYVGQSCAGKRSVSAHVGADLFERYDLVLEARDGAGIHVARDTRDILMGPLRPGFVVRLHLVTRRAAERRLIGRFRHTHVGGAQNQQREYACQDEGGSLVLRDPSAYACHRKPVLFVQRNGAI